MKTRILIFSIFMVFSSVAFNSCTEEDDQFDFTDDRDAFLGAWNVNETCSRDNYSVEIVKDPSNSSQVIIRNFWLIGYQEKPPYAIVAGNNITIPSQAMCNDGSNIVSGSGVLDKNGKEVIWNYSVNDGADLYNCQAKYEKP